MYHESSCPETDQSTHGPGIYMYIYMYTCMYRCMYTYT